MCPDLEKLRFDVAATCGDAKVFLGGLCHDRVPKRRLAPILGGARLGGGSSSLRVEVVHLTFYLVYSFLRHWLGSTAGIIVRPPYKVAVHRGMDWG